MPYEVIADTSVSVLKAHRPYTDDASNVIGYDHEAIVYLPGDIVEDGDVSPVVVDAYENEDEHTRSILKKVSSAEAKKLAEEVEETEEATGDSEQDKGIQKAQQSAKAQAQVENRAKTPKEEKDK